MVEITFWMRLHKWLTSNVGNPILGPLTFLSPPTPSPDSPPSLSPEAHHGWCLHVLLHPDTRPGNSFPVFYFHFSKDRVKALLKDRGSSLTISPHPPIVSIPQIITTLQKAPPAQSFKDFHLFRLGSHLLNCFCLQKSIPRAWRKIL